MNARSDAEILRSSEDIGYVGGGYYNPSEEFLAIARQLSSPLIDWLSDGPHVELDLSAKPTYLMSELYRELTSKLRRDELLFGVYDNRRYKIAVFLVNEERMMDFERQVLTRKLRRIAFFALASRQAEVGLVREFVH